MAKQTPTPKEKIVPPNQPQPTPEELKKAEDAKPVEGAAIDAFTSRFIQRPDGEKSPVKKEEKPPVKPKPKAKSAPVVPPAALTEEQIAEAAARGVATALKPAAEPAKTEPKTGDAVLAADEQRRISVLKQMEKSNPEQYNGIADRYQQSLKNLVEYAAKWEKDHPGETFDEDSDEHKAFVDENQKGIDWDDDDYTDALAEIKVEQKFSEQRKHGDDQIAKQKKIQDALPAISAARLAAGRSFLGKIGEDYAAIVGDDGKVNKEAYDALNAADPVKTEMIIQDADLVEKLVAENYALFNSIIPFDGKNQMHTTISNFIIQQESRLMKLPAAQQRDGMGRPFKTAADFWKLPKEQQDKFWTFTQKDVESLLVNGVFKLTKQKIDIEDKKFNDRAKARGLIASNGAPTQPTATAPARAPIPPVEDDDDDKPKTPDVPVQPRHSGGGAAQNTDPQESFSKKFLGRA